MDKYQLFSENINLAYYTLSRYLPTYLHNEDVIQLALLGLWRACDSYDANKSKFSTYATRCILNEVYKSFGSIRRYNKLSPISIESYYANNNDTEYDNTSINIVANSNDIGDIEEYVTLVSLCESFKLKDRMIIYYRMKGYSQAEIAKMLGIGQAAVSIRLARLRDKYKDELLK